MLSLMDIFKGYTKEVKLEKLHYVSWNIYNDHTRQSFTIAETREYGRIMLCHTKDTGQFSLTIKAIRHIYNEFGCQCLITCYPAMHYKRHPKVAIELNILYKRVNHEICSDLYRDKGIAKILYLV